MKKFLSRGLGVAFALLLVVPAFAQEAKDPNPPAGVPGEVPNATGGPDTFGYTWADQASGCAFNFIDISATGTFIFNGDDTSGTVALSAPFDFYGVSFNSLQMAANGYISTDLADSGPDLSNDCPIPAVPSTPGGTPGARMYPLHDDLDLEAGIGQGLAQYFPVCPRPSGRCAVDEDCTVFQWDNVAHFPAGGSAPTWDLQVILYHQTNDFVYQVGPGNPEVGSGSTTGIQDFSPPTTGLLYACNSGASIPDNTAVCFTHPNPLPVACLPYVPPVIQEVPTLGVVGLVGLALLLGAAAFLLMRRRTA